MNEIGRDRGFVQNMQRQVSAMGKSTYLNLFLLKRNSFQDHVLNSIQGKYAKHRPLLPAKTQSGFSWYPPLNGSFWVSESI